VLRGKVLDRNNAPLSSVKITILDHEEFGQTLSRTDGMFDMAVNGGGSLTVQYEKTNYLPSQRQVSAPWQEFVMVPDAVLVQLDSQMTMVDLTTPVMQVARGSMVSDGDGTRQATLLVPEGTTATLKMSDGSERPLTTLEVRATEYTVEANGQKAMPGALPPTSGYTYAVEYSVDDAIAQGASSVEFNQPLIHYVENFLGFQVGKPVPTGYYDRTEGRWKPLENGYIVNIISIANGLANLDTDGDGTVDNGNGTVQLLPLVTDAERQRLASLYPSVPPGGKSLWRVPIPHFTPIDCNWPFGPALDALQSLWDLLTDLVDALDCSTKAQGSIIGCEDQTLGEVVGVTGTRFGLHYTTDRVPGRKTRSTLNIKIHRPSTLPLLAKRLELEIQVGGRTFTEIFDNPTMDQQFTFAWDGLDAYGRPLQGGQTATISVGHVFDAVYYEPAVRAQNFAAITDSGFTATANRARQEVTLWKRRPVVLVPRHNPPLGVEGWSLTPHHVYDPVEKVLYLGNGRRRSVAGANGTVVQAVAGNGTAGSSGDGGLATEAQVNLPLGVAVAPDGNVYIAEYSGNRIRKVSPEGIISTIAGTGANGFSGDGEDARNAKLSGPRYTVVGPDGNVYFFDDNNNRIRKVEVSSPDKHVGINSAV
jgi:hypothetical protein